VKSRAPHLRRRAKDWIVRIEKTLKLAETLWEDDETQFGEPLATHMALLDAEFVPYYTRLLRLWDQGHEVHMAGCRRDRQQARRSSRNRGTDLVLHGMVRWRRAGLLKLLKRT